MPGITKAYAISDAKISFVSLVDKAANKKQFLITKATEEGKKNFVTKGRIIKADTDSHFVTGIVYEPMVEDSQGNYMTEEEITKAAYWFAKNGNSVDIQHCFVKCEDVAVVESYIAKCDMEIEGQAVKKGTWLMTVEVTNDELWDAVQKGEITGFSMGGVGVYSEEDVDLSGIEKADEPKGLLKKLAKALGFEVVEKGAVKAEFTRRVKEDNFYSAWYALRSTLEGYYYNPATGSWEYGYNPDEEAIREALEDFNDIVTQLLTSDGSIVKAMEKAAKEAPQAVEKAGKSLSAKNLETLQGISNNLTDFLSTFTETASAEGDGDNNNVKKEDDTDMKQEDVQKMVSDEVAKAMAPVTKQLEAIAKSLTGEGDGEGAGEGTPAAGEGDGAGADVTAESVAKMVGDEVTKAMEPITKMLEPLMKSRALPGNLNDAAGNNVVKSDEVHYMTGMF